MKDLIRFSARLMTNSATVLSERLRWLLNSEAMREIRLRDWRRWTGVRSLSFMTIVVAAAAVAVGEVRELRWADWDLCSWLGRKS